LAQLVCLVFKGAWTAGPLKMRPIGCPQT